MNIEIQLGDWYPLLRHVFDTPWMDKLGRRLGAAKNIQPDLDKVFRAFELCPPGRVKVVIIGQDPYPNGEADGLAFSSFGKSTPSLDVIFGEINRTHLCPRTITYLDDWAQQGVLLLNSVLTTEWKKTRAHAGWGWELFTQEVFKVLRQRYINKPLVIMAWGKDAQVLTKNIRTLRNEDMFPWLILNAPHPQAQNWNPRNKFIGCNHFIDANLFLMRHNIQPIWWSDIAYLSEFYGNRYQEYCELINQLRHAKNDIPEGLRSYPAVREEGLAANHTGLQPGDTEDLAF